jgi:hypothetical protein
LFVPCRQAPSDVKALFADGAIVECPERLGAAECAVEGVGHMGPVTHPDGVNTLIERYLTDGPTTPTE